MAIPTIREILEQKGVKLGNNAAGGKKFEVPKDFFTSSPIKREVYVPEKQTGDRYQVPDNFFNSKGTNIQKDLSSQITNYQTPQSSVIPQTTPQPTTQNNTLSTVNNVLDKIPEEITSGRYLENLQKATVLPVTAMGGLIGGIVNYVGESAKQSKDFLTGKVGYWDAQKKIWDQTIKGAKDTANFGQQAGISGENTFGLAQSHVLFPFMLYSTGKGIADTFSETGKAYEEYKSQGNKNSGVYATYQNIKKGSSEGFKLLGVDQKTADKLSENDFIAGIGNLFLYGGAYLASRGVAKDIGTLSSKLPILQMKPTGNKVLLSKETWDSIKNDPNFKHSIANQKVEIIKGEGGEKIAITLSDLQKIKPENIQSAVNQGKNVSQFIELKEFERTPWGTLQSQIQNGKLTTPKYGYEGRLLSNELPSPQTQIVDNLKLDNSLVKDTQRDVVGQINNVLTGDMSKQTPLGQKVANIKLENIDSPGKFYTEIARVINSDESFNKLSPQIQHKILGEMKFTEYSGKNEPTGILRSTQNLLRDVMQSGDTKQQIFRNGISQTNDYPSSYTKVTETQPSIIRGQVPQTSNVIPLPISAVTKVQLKGIQELTKKLNGLVAKKESGRITSSELSNINNLKSIITNLENTVATGEVSGGSGQISQDSIGTQPQGAQPATTNSSPAQRTRIIESQVPQQTTNINKIQQQPLPENVSSIIDPNIPESNQWIINSVDDRTLKPDGSKYLVTLSKSAGKVTFKKYRLGANGEKNLIYKIPESVAQKRYGTRNNGYIARRMVNPHGEPIRINPTLRESNIPKKELTKTGNVVYYKGEPYTILQTWANSEGVLYSRIKNNNTMKTITVKSNEISQDNTEVIIPEKKVTNLFSKQTNGRLPVDKNGNINLTTEEQKDSIKLDSSKLKIKEFNTQKELFDAALRDNKKQYIDQGYDVLMSGNRAIAITPRIFATKVGEKTTEPGRQQIGTLIRKATRIIKPVGRPQVSESQKKLEEQGLKGRAELKQIEKDALEKQKRLIEQEKKAQKEAEVARQLEVKQQLEEMKRISGSGIVTRKLTPQDLVKGEPKFITKEQSDIIKKDLQKEEQSTLISNTRKTINDKEYKAELIDLKNKGKDQQFFLDLYKKEFDKELALHEEGALTKSDVILDFIEGNYGFITIKSILQPVKLIERALNTGWEKGLRFIWKETGLKNFSDSLKEKLKLIPFTNSLGKKFVYNYGLPEWYKDLKREVKAKEVQTGDMARNVMNNLSKGLSEDQKVELHGAIINYGHSENPDIMARAKFAREILDTMGEQYWKSGAIDQSVYERNKGQYLPRLYYGEEMAQPLLQFVRSGGYKAGLLRAKKRGMEKLVSPNTLDEWIAKGWEDRGDASNGLVRIWRDYTVEERKKMGEITNEPGYLVAKGIQQVGYDTAVLNLFKNISVHPEVVSSEPIGEFQKLPDVKEYGALKGKYVDQYLYNDIKGIVEARQTANSIGNQILSEWKRFKVVDNPATHFRNIYFNFILSDVAGLSPARVDIYGSALIDIIKKQGDYKEAHDLGLFGTDWVGNELQSLISDKKVLNLKPGKNGVYEYNFKAQLGDNIITIVSKLKNIYDKTQGKLGDIYQAEEHLNKLGLYKFAKYDLNLGPKEALKFSEKWGLNYSAVTPFVTKYSTKWYGAPFLRFPTLAAPRIAEGILFRPFTILKWIAIMTLVEEYSRKKLGYTKEKLEQIKKEIFPEWMQTGLYILAPGLDKNDDPQFMDLTYIIPFVQETKDPLGQMYNYVFGNPIPKTAFELILNRSGFTMNDIVNKTLYPDLMSQLPIYLQYVYQQVAPPIAPGNYNFNKLWDAIKQKPDYAGRVNDVFGSISTTIFGLKLRSLDLSNEQKWRLIELKQNDSEYAKKIMSLKNDKSLTDSEKKKQIDRLVNMRKENMQKALQINRANQPEVEPYTNFFLDK